MKKSLFLTFCFACCPGAGQMYLGYTKRGASIMLAFFALFGLSAFLNLWLVSVILPVIWFFAFFDTFAIRNATPEELAAKPDCFLYDLPGIEDLSNKYHVALGWVFIFIGLYALYNNLFMPVMANVLDMLPYDLWWLWNLFYEIPTFIVAVLIILVGVRLIRGKKQPPDDDVITFQGEMDHED